MEPAVQVNLPNPEIVQEPQISNPKQSTRPVSRSLFGSNFSLKKKATGNKEEDGNPKKSLTHRLFHPESRKSIRKSDSTPEIQDNELTSPNKETMEKKPENKLKLSRQLFRRDSLKSNVKTNVHNIGTSLPVETDDKGNIHHRNLFNRISFRQKKNHLEAEANNSPKMESNPPILDNPSNSLQETGRYKMSSFSIGNSFQKKKQITPSENSENLSSLYLDTKLSTGSSKESKIRSGSFIRNSIRLKKRSVSEEIDNSSKQETATDSRSSHAGSVGKNTWFISNSFRNKRSTPSSENIESSALSSAEKLSKGTKDPEIKNKISANDPSFANQPASLNESDKTSTVSRSQDEMAADSKNTKSGTSIFRKSFRLKRPLSTGEIHNPPKNVQPKPPGKAEDQVEELEDQVEKPKDRGLSFVRNSFRLKRPLSSNEISESKESKSDDPASNETKVPKPNSISSIRDSLRLKKKSTTPTSTQNVSSVEITESELHKKPKNAKTIFTDLIFTKMSTADSENMAKNSNISPSKRTNPNKKYSQNITLLSKTFSPESKENQEPTLCVTDTNPQSTETEPSKITGSSAGSGTHPPSIILGRVVAKTGRKSVNWSKKMAQVNKKSRDLSLIERKDNIDDKKPSPAKKDVAVETSIERESSDSFNGRQIADNLDLVFLQGLMDSPLMQSLLKVQDRLEERINRPISSDSIALNQAVLDQLRSSTSKDTSLLQSILSDPHFKALLDIHDQIAHKKLNLEEKPPAKSHQTSAHPPEKPPINGSSEVEMPADVSSVRIVGLRKSPGEPLGLTVKSEEGQLVVARILGGGAVDRQGILHVGDIIGEVNGISVRTPEQLQVEIARCKEHIQLKILPSCQESCSPGAQVGLHSGTILASETLTNIVCFVRAHFDYEPKSDKLLPCPEIGLAFKKGDILQVVNQSDPNWWQAKKVGWSGPAGLIPSQELEERRKAYVAPEADFVHKIGFCGTRISKKKKKLMYQIKSSIELDKAELLLYEEVTRMPPFRRKTLVLIGSEGVGRRTLKNRLINSDSDRFGTTMPHTSRPMRELEEDGMGYWFVSREEMEHDIRNHQFLEWGEHNGHLYGTKLDSIRSIIRQGKMCVLDCSPSALKVLHNSPEFMPFVIFLSAPGMEQLKHVYDRSRYSSRTLSFERSGSLRYSSRRARTLESLTSLFEEEDFKNALEESARIQRTYEKYFDQIIVNEDPDVTFRKVVEALETLSNQHQWVPVSWVY